jgi:type IV pilus assembly protein PilM
MPRLSVPSLKRAPKHKSVVGLELDPAHVAAVEAVANGTISVKQAAVTSLRPGVLRDGEVTDGAELTARIQQLWADNTLPKRVRLGIANQRIVVRTLDLPPLTDPKAIASAVQVEAPDHIPMPMEEAITDYQVLGVVDTPSGQRTRVVVVAVRREMIDRYVEAVRAADLEIEGIDLSAFALVRALAGPDDTDGIIYVNVAGLTNVAVAVGPHCLFTRAAAGGLDSMVHTLAERRGLTTEHATQWIAHVGMEQPVGEIEGDLEVVTATRTVLDEGVHQLADTVRNSLNFYRMQQNAQLVSRVALTGPATAVPGLAGALADKLAMLVEVRGVAGDGVITEPERLVVATGLALEAR